MADLKPINYISSSEYSSSTKPNFSTVTLENDTDVLHYDGYNIEHNINSVTTGDIVIKIGNSFKFYEPNSVKNINDIAPSDDNVIGVVIKKQGTDLLVHYKDPDVSMPMINYWAYKVPVTANTLTVYYNTSGSSTANWVALNGTFQNSSTDLNEWADAFNTWLQSDDRNYPSDMTKYKCRYW